ncbi:MAG TPA: hypothetical protein VF258_08180 [Luteolibacter sp.]
MDWIFDHFQIVVLILLAIGSAVKSLLGKNAKEFEEPYEPGEVSAPDQSYRKSSPQALPTGPPPLARASIPPSTQQAGYDAEVANETAKALKHQQDLAARLRQIRETKATTSGGASATRARVAAKGKTKPFAQSPLSLRNRLRDPAEVRRAIVMREILDSPVGLR